MKITQEKEENRQAFLTVELEPAEMEEALEDAYKNLSKKADIPGFRKGKAPRNIVERHLGRNRLVEEAVNKLVPQAYEQALKEQEIDAFAQPDIELTQADPVIFKAVVPLGYLDVRTQQEVKFGVLVVDSGPEQKPISAEEFEYLLIMADLIGEAVGKVELINELIRSYENRKELIKSMTHFLRNRFMVVGGFARRLHKKARDEDVKGYAQVISKEIGDIETYLHALEESPERLSPLPALQPLP